MKLYSISKLVFSGVMVLILLLPLGRHWRLLSTGEQSKGTVQNYTPHLDHDMFGEAKLIWASEVSYQVGDSICIALGPVDMEMKPGKIVPVYYEQDNPSRYCLLNLSSLYFSSYTILPLILIFVWWAFYLSYNNYHREKMGDSHTPASSPYVPFRRKNSTKKKPGDKQRRISGKSSEEQ